MFDAASYIIGFEVGKRQAAEKKRTGASSAQSSDQMTEKETVSEQDPDADQDGDI